MKHIYYPFIIGSDSPIPYMYEELSTRICSYEITTFSNTNEQVVAKPNVHEILVPAEGNNWHRRLRLGLSSLGSYDLIHTGGRERRHYRVSRIAHMRNRGLNHVHTLRVDVDPNADLGATSYRRKLVEMADVVTAVSKHTAQTAEKYFGVSPQIIYEGVNPDIFHPGCSSPDLFDDLDIESPVYLFVGSFEPRKNPGDVIEVAENIPEATFLMVGGGQLYPEIEEQAQSMDNVILTGRLPKKILPSIYAHSTGFIFPTVREGCANVVLEAMASGLPVLGYEATSMPELVSNGKSGYLVESGDTTRLTERAIHLLDCDDHERMGKNARDYAVENHAFEVLANQYISLYDQLEQSP